MGGFPAALLLDSFDRHENPLSNFRQWAQLPWTPSIGLCWGDALLGGPRGVAFWTPEGLALVGGEPTTVGASEGGAYWTPHGFAAPAVSCRFETTEIVGRWAAVWACLDPLTHSGYRVRAESLGGGRWHVKIEKAVGGVITVMNSATVFLAGRSFPGLGLTVLRGVLTAWVSAYGISGGWEEIASVPDASFNEGAVGIENNGGEALSMIDFSAGPQLIIVPPQAIPLVASVVGTARIPKRQGILASSARVSV